MVSIDNLFVEFSAKPLFSGVSYVINPRDRIALVGKNGAGKSTMLKIIAGQQQPTGGTVSMPRQLSVGYLPQAMQFSDERSVRDEAALAFAHIHEMQAELDRLSRQLAERTDYESDEYMALVEHFTQADEHFQLMGGQNYQGELERTLAGLGFRQEDLERPTSEFSGGWRMRIELAKLLLQRPDVLLLDEPTNHLDIESIQWLEQFLQQYQGAVVMVSHDRAFINNVTTRTIEISCGQIYDYRVRYDEYLSLRAERREQQLRAYENQQREIAETRAFIERFRYQATKANQVQSRIKALEKIVPIEIDEVDNSALRLRFTCSQRSGDFPVICDDVRKAYGQHEVLAHVNLTIRRGEKVAFVGRNGEGKTTLVRCIMGQTDFDGHLKIGHNVEIGYFAQNQAWLLDPELTVLQTIDRAARGDIRTRLAMIKLLLEPANLLILDEPTNHLDLRSKDVLKEAIRQFDGTVILVSHDRHFLSGLVSRVYEFSGGRVREHLGGIYDYLRPPSPSQAGDTSHLKESSSGKGEHLDYGRDKRRDALHTPSLGGGRGRFEQQKARARERERARARELEAEAQVTQLEQAVALLERQFALQPSLGADAAQQQRYQQLRLQLQQAMTLWEQAALQAEQLGE